MNLKNEILCCALFLCKDSPESCFQRKTLKQSVCRSSGSSFISMVHLMVWELVALAKNMYKMVGNLVLISRVLFSQSVWNACHIMVVGRWAPSGRNFFVGLAPHFEFINELRVSVKFVLWIYFEKFEKLSTFHFNDQEKL